MCCIRRTESYPNCNLISKTQSIKFLCQSHRVWSRKQLMFIKRTRWKKIINFVIILSFMTEKNNLEMRTKLEMLKKIKLNDVEIFLGAGRKMSVSFKGHLVIWNVNPTFSDCRKKTDWWLRLWLRYLKPLWLRYLILDLIEDQTTVFFFMSFLIPYFISDIEAEPVVVKKLESDFKHGLFTSTCEEASSIISILFFKRLVIAAKETHCNRTMAISMFEYTYRSEKSGTSSKVKPTATFKREWEEQCRLAMFQFSKINQINNHHNRSELLFRSPETIVKTYLLPKPKKEYDSFNTRTIWIKLRIQLF